MPITLNGVTYLRMADGPVANLPAGMDAYGGYVNDSGDGETWPGVEAFAEQQKAEALSITTNGSVAMTADVEKGAMSKWTGYGWGYCSVSNVNSLITQYGRPPKLWTAHQDPAIGAHICSPDCWPGLMTVADGTQWIDHGGWDESLLLTSFFTITPPGGDVPASTDVVDSWSVPGTDGNQYFNLHADGGLFAYGGAAPTLLEYIACSNDGGRYHFPSGTVISYPGLPAADRQGTRYFVKMTPIKYNGQAIAGT